MVKEGGISGALRGCCLGRCSLHRSWAWQSAPDSARSREGWPTTVLRTSS
jgi:hypothetical protein